MHQYFPGCSSKVYCAIVVLVIGSCVYLYSHSASRLFLSESIIPYKSGATRMHSTYNKTKVTAAPSVLVDNSKNDSFRCKETFNKTLEENLAVIKNYPRGNAGDYLIQLGINKEGPDLNRTFPVFVTAFDHIYYFSSQGLFQSLHEQFLNNSKYAEDVLIIVYDLGMTSLQYQKVKKHCRCEIRRFPFEKFPQHVMNLETYAFKPIIVQQLLMEYGFVWWMDSSIRFMVNTIDPALEYAMDHGILYTVSTNRKESISIPKQTDAATFEFLREDRCKFRPFAEIWATTILFHYDVISRAVVQAWVTCALNKECIAPAGSEKKFWCNPKNSADGRCHRFDQSVLGIIMRRLEHERNLYPLDSSLTSIYSIKRGHLVPYFL